MIQVRWEAYYLYWIHHHLLLTFTIFSKDYLGTALNSLDLQIKNLLQLGEQQLEESKLFIN